MITNWDQLPLVLDSNHLAELLGLDVQTVHRRCSPKVRNTKRQMRPAPIEWQRPYRWYREHVRAQIESRAVGIPVGRKARRLGPFARVREIRQELAKDAEVAR